MKKNKNKTHRNEARIFEQKWVFRRRSHGVGFIIRLMKKLLALHAVMPPRRRQLTTFSIIRNWKSETLISSYAPHLKDQAFLSISYSMNDFFIDLLSFPIHSPPLTTKFG